MMPSASIWSYGSKEPVAHDRVVLRWLARFAREKAFSLAG
jgi:hypothetical protein